MAAYNGAQHIGEQLGSILSELGSDDEVIIVDDCSSDSTAQIIALISDPRIRYFRNSRNQGYVKSFERALKLSRGEYVMLSDQDDVWIHGRVNLLIGALAEAKLAVGNCAHFGGEPGFFQRLRLKSQQSNHHLRNIIGIVVGYRLHWGSAMAIRRDFLSMVLPFPTGMTESHDQWLALMANIDGSVQYLNQDTVRHRLHAVNVTPRGMRNIWKILRARFQFAINITVAYRRIMMSN